MIVSKASTFRTISLHGELHRHQTMSVRDRIANLNSSKTPIVTTVGSINATNSAQLPKTNRVDSTSSNTNSTETVDKESSDIEGNGMKKASTIAERIAKLKAGQGVGQIDAAATTAGKYSDNCTLYIIYMPLKNKYLIHALFMSRYRVFDEKFRKLEDCAIGCKY